MRVIQSGIAAAKRRAIQTVDAAAGGSEHRLPRRRVPNHGAAQTRIKVRLAAGEETELQGAAGARQGRHATPTEEGLEGRGIAMRT